MYGEFQNRFDAYKMGKISTADYQIVEKAYNFHPRYDVRNPKDVVVEDYARYGIGFFGLLLKDIEEIRTAEAGMYNAAQARIKAQTLEDRKTEEYQKVYDRMVKGANLIAKMMKDGIETVQIYY